MPAYNAGAHIKDAVESVLKQTYANWELLIIDDGSMDNTREVVGSIENSRVKYFYQENKGASAARNMGLQCMKGEYFCFLDADDILPPYSLEVRLKKFTANKELAFVDGEVLAMDYDLKTVFRHYQPRFKGRPFSQLKQLSDSCFYGITWMIKKKGETKYAFNTDFRYSEDLVFYLEHSEEGLYDYVDQIIYINRKVGTSAMHNFKALAAGYRKLLPFLLANYSYTFKEKLRLIFKVWLLIIKLSVRHYLK
jgi:glycosyltransferase involved in cell wall biosynthesis